MPKAEDAIAGAAKRFKRTATGKFLRGKAFKQHILTSKTRSGSAGCAARRRWRRSTGRSCADAAVLR